MGDGLAQTRAESLVGSVIEMALATEEKHLVFHQRAGQLGNGLLRQIG